MNRRKKGIQILKARAKKANAKLAPKKKPRYISKAERAEMEAAASTEATPQTESNEVEPAKAD